MFIVTATNGVKFRQADVNVEVNGITVVPQHHHVRFIRDVYATNKIAAIRFVRAEHPCLGLKEAKDLCDAIVEVGNPDRFSRAYDPYVRNSCISHQ